MFKKVRKIKRELIPVEEAFSSWTERTKTGEWEGYDAKFIDLNFGDELPEGTQAGFKLYKQDNYQTLEVYYNGTTLILPRVELTLSYTAIIGSTPTDEEVQPILFTEDFDDGNIEEGRMTDVLVIVLFGTHLTLDNNFTAERLSNNVFKVEHAKYPKKYVHKINCDFTKVMPSIAGTTTGSWSDVNVAALHFPYKVPSQS